MQRVAVAVALLALVSLLASAAGGFFLKLWAALALGTGCTIHHAEVAIVMLSKLLALPRT
jgi:hypothetical protein